MGSGIGMLGILGMSVGLIVLCVLLERLLPEYWIYKVMKHGVEMEVIVVGSKKRKYGNGKSLISFYEVAYSPIVVYVLGDLPIQATALNHLKREMPVGMLCTAKIWGEKPTSAVVLDCFDGQKKTVIPLLISSFIFFWIVFISLLVFIFYI